MASSPITSWQIEGEAAETVTYYILGGSKSLQMVTAAMKLKDAYSLKEKSEKVGLKFNIQKTKIMAPSPITSWQIDAEEWKQ